MYFVPCCVNLRWLSTVITHRSHFLHLAEHSPSSSPHASERQNLPTEYLPNCWSYYVFALTIGDTLNVMAQYGLVKMKDKLDNSMMGHSCGQSGGIKNSGWSQPLFFLAKLPFRVQLVNMNMCLIWRGTHIGHIIAQHVQVPHCLSQALKGEWQTNNYQRHKGPEENNSL